MRLECEKQEVFQNTTFKTAPKIEDAFSATKTTKELVSNIIDKFVAHVPLYRQELLFKQANVVLNRQNMSNWLVEASNILKPVVDLIQEKIKESKFIHADETTFQVLKENNRKPTQKVIYGLRQYKKINNVVNMACLVHIRRKFYEVHEILEGNTKEKAHVLLTLYNDLYNIERKIVDLPRNERLNIRQKESKEILNLIHK